MGPTGMSPGTPMWAPNFCDVLDRAVRGGIKIHERQDLIDPLFHQFLLNDPETKENINFRIEEYKLHINNHPDLLHVIAQIEKFMDDCDKHRTFLKVMGAKAYASIDAATISDVHASVPVILKDAHGNDVKVQPEFVAIWQNICNNVDKELKSRGEFVIDYAKLTDVLIQLGIALPKDEEN